MENISKYRSIIVLIVLSIILVVVSNITRIPNMSSNESDESVEGALILSSNMAIEVVGGTPIIPTPLTEEAKANLSSLKAQIESCPDYSTFMLEQMLSNLNLLINPSDIPLQTYAMLGNNLELDLVYTLSSNTGIQWLELNRPAESCLIEIGRDLNVLLEAVGLEPLTIYDE